MKSKKHFEKAQEIKHGSAGFLNELNREAKSLIAKAKTDTLLSAEGRRVKSQEIQKEKGVELLQKIHHRKNQYVGHLKKALESAKEELKKPIAKPSAEELETFTKAFKELKTTIFLTPRSESAEKRLKDFVSEIKHPYLAHLVREDFSELVGSIISNAGSQAPQAKMRLFDLYEGLEKDFLSEEYLEAKEIANYSEAEIANNRLMPGFINGEPSLQVSSVISVFGNDVAKWIDKTDVFFAENEDVEPLQDTEVSDFDESGQEKRSNAEILAEAEMRALTGDTESKIRFAMLKKELEA